MKYFIILVALIASACTQVESDKVGLRFDNTGKVRGEQLSSDTWHQILFGKIKSFSYQNLTAEVSPKTLTVDNTIPDSFDITVVYNIKPDAIRYVFEKSKFYHTDDKLMHKYIITTTNNAAESIIRTYKMLDLYDNRILIAEQIRIAVVDQLVKDQLDSKVSIDTVTIENLMPDRAILRSLYVTLDVIQQDLKK